MKIKSAGVAYAVRLVFQESERIMNYLMGVEIVRMMRTNKVTIRALASFMKITMKRVRYVRANGVTGISVSDWIDGINGAAKKASES